MRLDGLSEYPTARNYQSSICAVDFIQKSTQATTKLQHAEIQESYQYFSSSPALEYSFLFPPPSIQLIYHSRSMVIASVLLVPTYDSNSEMNHASSLNRSLLRIPVLMMHLDLECSDRSKDLISSSSSVSEGNIRIFLVSSRYLVSSMQINLERKFCSL